jgi:hypothetical protein
MAGEQRSNDLLLQMLFVCGLILVIALFYWTRIVGLKANNQDSLPADQYANSTAYELEQAEQQIQAKIKILQADYANDLVTFQKETIRIKSSTDFTDLEKKEKLKYLNDLYSDDHFKNKQDLIDQEYRKLENLKRVECAKFCDISNL